MTMTEPTDIPTDVRDLVAYLEVRPLQEWAAIKDALIGENAGEDFAMQLWDDATEEVQLNLDIRQKRFLLAEAVRHLGVHSRYAVAHLRDLMRDLYDADYAEGTNGHDLTTLLDQVAQDVRLAGLVLAKIVSDEKPEATS